MINQLLAELDWCIDEGCAEPRMHAALVAARQTVSALANQQDKSRQLPDDDVKVFATKIVSRGHYPNLANRVPCGTELFPFVEELAAALGKSGRSSQTQPAPTISAEMALFLSRCSVDELAPEEILRMSTPRSADAQPHGDNCQFCHGAKGGVRGNENNMNGVVVCDYCTVLINKAISNTTTK